MSERRIEERMIDILFMKKFILELLKRNDKGCVFLRLWCKILLNAFHNDQFHMSAAWQRSIFTSTNQSNFYSANIPAESQGTLESVFNSKLEETAP